MPYTTYVPKEISELLDFLGMMLLSAPTFLDESGYFPRKNLDTVFVALHQGLSNVRAEINEDRFAQLTTLSQRMRTHFEADPNEVTGDTANGCAVIHQMEDILNAAWLEQSRTKNS